MASSWETSTLEKDLEELMDKEYGNVQPPPCKNLRGRNLFLVKDFALHPTLSVHSKIVGRE